MGRWWSCSVDLIWQRREGERWFRQVGLWFASGRRDLSILVGRGEEASERGNSELTVKLTHPKHMCQPCFKGFTSAEWHARQVLGVVRVGISWSPDGETKAHRVYLQPLAKQLVSGKVGIFTCAEKDRKHFSGKKRDVCKHLGIRKKGEIKQSYVYMWCINVTGGTSWFLAMDGIKSLDGGVLQTPRKTPWQWFPLPAVPGWGRRWGDTEARMDVGQAPWRTVPGRWLRLQNAESTVVQFSAHSAALIISENFRAVVWLFSSLSCAFISCYCCPQWTTGSVS